MPAQAEPPGVTDGEVDGDRIDGADGIQSVERPSAADAASIVEAAMERGRVVSLVGACDVEAIGGDRLRPGKRHALLKPDGSVVVHGPDGTAPEVVLSGSGGLEANAVDGSLEVGVTGDGEGDGDGRRLRFGRVYLLSSAAIDATPDGHETDDRSGTTTDAHETLRERLLSEPDRIEPGFRPLSTERATSAGPVDVFGRDAEGRAVVVEIKAGRAGPAAAGQLDRYVSALRRDLHAEAEVRGVLVAPSATDRTRRLLDERGFAFRALSPDGDP